MPSHSRPTPSRARALTRVSTGAALAALFIGGPLSGAANAAIQVPLGTASAFSVLAGSTVTNTGPTTISRDVGLHPGSSVTGASEMTVAGTYHVADAVALKAKDDLTTAYNQAAGPLQDPVTNVATELGGTTLVGGTYNTGGPMGLTGQLTLDAKGNSNTVWVFQTSSTLITATDSSVIMTNGGNPCNVYWQVGSSATLGVRTKFIGTVMAHTTITLNTGASVEGRVLASTGAVNLHANRIFGSGCANETQVAGGTKTPPTATPTPTPTPTPKPTPTPGGGTTGTDGGTGGTGGGGTTTTGTNGGTGGGTTTTTTQVKQTPTGAVNTGYAGPATTSIPASSTALDGWLLSGGFGVLALVAVRRRQRS